MKLISLLALLISQAYTTVYVSTFMHVITVFIIDRLNFLFIAVLLRQMRTNRQRGFIVSTGRHIWLIIKIVVNLSHSPSFLSFPELSQIEKLGIWEHTGERYAFRYNRVWAVSQSRKCPLHAFWACSCLLFFSLLKQDWDQKKEG